MAPWWSPGRLSVVIGSVSAMGSEFVFEAELFEWDGPAAWVFATLPADLADVIHEVHGEHARGFGSLRVEVGIGEQVWRTSIFPDSKAGTFVLPVKKDVRRRAGVEVGDVVEIDLSVL
jgi:hypothetical protein